MSQCVRQNAVRRKLFQKDVDRSSARHCLRGSVQATLRFRMQVAALNREAMVRRKRRRESPFAGSDLVD
jgi:hypothetical protein